MAESSLNAMQLGTEERRMKNEQLRWASTCGLWTKSKMAGRNEQVGNIVDVNNPEKSWKRMPGVCNHGEWPSFAKFPIIFLCCLALSLKFVTEAWSNRGSGGKIRFLVQGTLTRKMKNFVSVDGTLCREKYIAFKKARIIHLLRERVTRLSRAGKVKTWEFIRGSFWQFDSVSFAVFKLYK